MSLYSRACDQGWPDSCERIAKFGRPVVQSKSLLAFPDRDGGFRVSLTHVV